MALTHELLHAYDHCRAANLNWTNCEHHACSEVRLFLDCVEYYTAGQADQSLTSIMLLSGP